MSSSETTSDHSSPSSTPSSDDAGKLPVPEERRPLVVRSNVEPEEDYTNYRPALRRDFFYSCAYCSIMESELTARRFTIDHYEPVSLGDGADNRLTEYRNLMYCCETCNSFKGSLAPPPNAREAGLIYFRPDEHFHEDHFERSGRRVNEKSSIGFFTINALNLNRDQLQRLRDIRRRLGECDAFIASGIAALKDYPIDRLPPAARSKAIEVRDKLAGMQASLESDLDEFLRQVARNPLEGDGAPPVDERDKDRLAKIKELEGLYPGVWRGRKSVDRATKT